MWQQPKLDWQPSDYYNYEDLNRVENNTLVIAELLAHFDSPITISAIINRDMKWIEFASSLNRIENNQIMLANRFKPVNWMDNKFDWQANTPFTYEDAKRLEHNLNLLYLFYFGNFSARPSCGMVTCGEEVI